MADIYIRGLPDDIQTVLKDQAKHKNMSMNEYAKELLTHCAIAAMPAIAAALPGTIEYTLRNILHQDTDRILAYTDAQFRLMQDAVQLMTRIEKRIESDSTADITP